MAKILIADDDEDFRYMAKSTLVSAKHEVVEAANGLEAIKFTHAAVDEGVPFQIVMLDLHMPGWSGDETVSHLVELQPKPRLILCTGQSDDPMINYPDSMGFDAVLVKPFTLASLRETVDRLMSLPA